MPIKTSSVYVYFKINCEKTGKEKQKNSVFPKLDLSLSVHMQSAVPLPPKYENKGSPTTQLHC